MDTFSRVWAATQPLRHAVAGGVSSALIAAWAFNADEPVSAFSTHQWIGLAVVFCAGAGLTKYTIPAPTATPVASPDRGVYPDPHAIEPMRGVEPDPHAMTPASRTTSTRKKA